MCTYQCFPPEERGAGIPWELDQQKITSSGNLTEDSDTGTAPWIEILEEIMCTFMARVGDFWHTFVTHG